MDHVLSSESSNASSLIHFIQTSCEQLGLLDASTASHFKGLFTRTCKEGWVTNVVETKFSPVYKQMFQVALSLQVLHRGQTSRAVFRFISRDFIHSV